MWASIVSKLAQWGLTYIVMPFLSSLIVSIMKYFQEKREEAERNAAVDAAIKRYKEAADAKAQEDAFRDLIRARNQ